MDCTHNLKHNTSQTPDCNMSGSNWPHIKQMVANLSLTSDQIWANDWQCHLKYFKNGGNGTIANFCCFKLLIFPRRVPVDLMKVNTFIWCRDVPFMSLSCSVLQDLKSCLKNLCSSRNLQGLRLWLPMECKHVRGRQRFALSGHRNWQAE